MTSAFDTLRNSGGGGDSYVHVNVGDSCTIAVTSWKDHDFGEPGKPQVSLIVSGKLVAFQGGTVAKAQPYVGQDVSVICGGAKGAALFEAAMATGATDLEYGAMMTMTHHATKPAPGKPQDQKLYRVDYRRPTVGQTGQLGGVQFQPPAQPGQPSGPANAPGGGQYVPQAPDGGWPQPAPPAYPTPQPPQYQPAPVQPQYQQQPVAQQYAPQGNVPPEWQNEPQPPVQPQPAPPQNVDPAQFFPPPQG